MIKAVARRSKVSRDIIVRIAASTPPADGNARRWRCILFCLSDKTDKIRRAQAGTNRIGLRLLQSRNHLRLTPPLRDFRACRCRERKNLDRLEFERTSVQRFRDVERHLSPLARVATTRESLTGDARLVSSFPASKPVKKIWGTLDRTNVRRVAIMRYADLTGEHRASEGRQGVPRLLHSVRSGRRAGGDCDRVAD